MHADPAGVLTGAHFLDGDHACCEGALAAECRFVAGYPITPSTEVVERIAQRFPQVGGIFIQMEDELASSIAIAGAVWGGKRAMTVTSGPGFSLMMEHIGFAVMTETPCVFVNVQRGGPSTGLPTLPAQADMMQARWGSHGDYEIIAVSPNSPQECFDLTIKAFNLAEQYRVPVLVMMDECVGHMMERVVIPKPEEIDIYPRRFTTAPLDEYLPFAPEAGHGARDGARGPGLPVPHDRPHARREGLPGHDRLGPGEPARPARRQDQEERRRAHRRGRRPGRRRRGGGRSPTASRRAWR